MFFQVWKGWSRMGWINWPWINRICKYSSILATSYCSQEEKPWGSSKQSEPGFQEIWNACELRSLECLQTLCVHTHDVILIYYRIWRLLCSYLFSSLANSLLSKIFLSFFLKAKINLFWTQESRYDKKKSPDMIWQLHKSLV